MISSIKLYCIVSYADHKKQNAFCSQSLPILSLWNNPRQVHACDNDVHSFYTYVLAAVGQPFEPKRLQHVD